MSFARREREKKEIESCLEKRGEGKEMREREREGESALFGCSS